MIELEIVQFFLWLCSCAMNYEMSVGARSVVYIYLKGMPACVDNGKIREF